MAREAYVDVDMRGERKAHDPDRAIAELAGRQHGHVSRAQLLGLPLSPAAIDRRVRGGRLHVVQRGVYAVGYRHGTQEGVWIAAVLAAGVRAVLSHLSAAALWRILTGGGPIADVTVPTQRRPRPGIRFHHASLPFDELTVCNGIPVTTVARTIFDLAAVVRPRQVERSMNEADVQRLWGPLSLDDLLVRYPGHRGNRAVRRALAARRAGASVTRSELEEALVEFVEERGFTRPELNALLELGGEIIEVDALWRAERVAVELDGRAFHDVPAAFERDRRRDRKLAARGWRPVRVTWRQLTRERDELEADLRRLLARSTLAA
jgi:very-short-patch-repair endonuclease